MDAFTAAYLALHLVDWGQTLDIAKHPEAHYEYNPILGKHPSVRKVNTYMTLSAVAVLSLDKWVFKENSYFRGAILIGLSGVDYRNYTVGLRMDF